MDRPRTRGDCIDGPRPCPWISCYFHIWTIQGAKRAACPLDLPETCVLDLADRNGMTLAAISRAIRVSTERVRQIQDRALAKLMANANAHDLLSELQAQQADSTGNAHFLRPVLMRVDLDSLGGEEDEDSME